MFHILLLLNPGEKKYFMNTFKIKKINIKSLLLFDDQGILQIH